VQDKVGRDKCGIRERAVDDRLGAYGSGDACNRNLDGSWSRPEVKTNGRCRRVKPVKEWNARQGSFYARLGR